MDYKKIKNEIAKLPSGGITHKKIKNYDYVVYQWCENGKQHSRYLKGDEIKQMNDKITKRKELEKQLAKQEKLVLSDDFYTNILIGDSLKRSLIKEKKYKKRKIIKALEEYVFSEEFKRVFILYGLRRTGKTTMMKQVILEMDEKQFNKTAFIQITSSDDFANLNKDLRKLANDGYEYIFIDEVTLMNDFIEGAALLSDIYVASGIKIILSGTDSLGFWLSKSNELYDRCDLLHTSFITYYEFEDVLGIKGIDNYIQYGGTMSISGNHYNAFSTIKGIDEYIDSAIAKNIQHSLKCYQDEGHFRHLYDLYEKNELTSAINRVVEDINHRFTLNVLTKDFNSNDLALSARNLRKENNNILDLIDKETTINKLKEILEIKNKWEQKIALDETHKNEIKEYLINLDLIKAIPVVDIDSYASIDEKIVFTQAGIRYCQAKSLIEVLLLDEAFKTLSFDDRKKVTERILNEIKGRMLEDHVLLETTIANPDKEVFKLMFSDGEYDMMVLDSEKCECSIYEIKYSNIIDKMQYRHLINEEKARKTEFRYGKIKGRYVLYRGESKIVDSIQYLNVEEYLKSLYS